MKDIFPIVSSSPLFEGIGSADFASVMGCLGGAVRNYGKAETVLGEGDAVSEVGILVDGRLHLSKCDIWGNNSIVTEITPPGMFAEAVVCAGLGRAPVSVVAKEASRVLFIDYLKIVGACPSGCEFHTRLIRNMIGVLARKNIVLSSKIEHITKRTTKEKLLSYLGDAARQASGAPSGGGQAGAGLVFEIPYNRQELADYLSVERSALSAEMSKLKAAGVIDYKKNRFVLLGDLGYKGYDR
ncbi:MAG: Crp/Fnr family transcriptional regulator [Lachnospiraceae bacterium]|jgi:CRP-like cAMP-binding protein|nr:Crp/Fnr family transcriptional regulator [Lachnospiraceae bacterium]